MCCTAALGIDLPFSLGAESLLCCSRAKRSATATAFFAVGSFYGAVVQLVRTPACHAGGREFESRRPRQIYHLVRALQFFNFRRLCTVLCYNGLKDAR